MGGLAVSRESSATMRRPTSRFQPSIITNSSTLNGSEIIAGGSCSMPIDSSVVETTRSMSRNGHEQEEPHLKAGLQLRDDEGRNRRRASAARRASSGRGSLAELDEQREVGLARLLQHELAQRRRAARRAPRSRSIWPAIAGCTASALIRVADRRHDEHGQEQRQADQDLVRRHLLRAERLPQEMEDDGDSRERGHRHEDRRAETTAASAGGRSAAAPRRCRRRWMLTSTCEAAEAAPSAGPQSGAARLS